MEKDALKIAEEAKQMASEAITQQRILEAVQTERYKNIDMRLNQLPDISKAIGSLKGSVNRAVGAVMALSILSVILGIILACIQISEKAV